MIQAGWSLAQAISHIIFQKCGLSLPADQSTSVALVMNFDEWPDLPPNAALSAEGELLQALAAGKFMASAIRENNGLRVDIAAREWLHLHIRPSFDGDKLVAGSDILGDVAYRDVRFLPEDLNQTWPPATKGGALRLQIVGGTHSEQSVLTALAQTNVQIAKLNVSKPSLKKWFLDVYLPKHPEQVSRDDIFAVAKLQFPNVNRTRMREVITENFPGGWSGKSGPKGPRRSTE